MSPAFPTPTYQIALTRALALRPDITAQQQSVVSLQESLRAARLGNFPTLNAIGQLRHDVDGCVAADRSATRVRSASR